MKKIKFEFFNNSQQPVTEIFEFDEAMPEVMIRRYFDEWFFNELDRAGIEGYYEEVEE